MVVKEREGGTGRIVKVRDVLKVLRRVGWVLRHQVGSHRRFVHPQQPGTPKT
jgi:predicted RNA binding protein YcfA (HicA-like mRNA interferase family)